MRREACWTRVETSARAGIASDLRMGDAYACYCVGGCSCCLVPEQHAAVDVAGDDNYSLGILTGTRHRRRSAARRTGRDAEVAQWVIGGGGGGWARHVKVERETQGSGAR